jgi:hypothetical protein
MKFLSTEEHISKITDLLKTQNRRVRLRRDLKGVGEQEEREKIQAVIKNFEWIKKHVSEELMPALQKLPDNERYTFQYIDDFEDTKLYETTFKSNYFKIIIKNIMTEMTNFIIVSFNMREFLVKYKTPNSESDIDVIDRIFPNDRFSRGKFRMVFFEYLEQIVTLDTFPKIKRKKAETDESAETTEQSNGKDEKSDSNKALESKKTPEEDKAQNTDKNTDTDKDADKNKTQEIQDKVQNTDKIQNPVKADNKNNN